MDRKRKDVRAKKGFTMNILNLSGVSMMYSVYAYNSYLIYNQIFLLHRISVMQ